MIKIAHRGNMNGPNPELENDPEYLLKAVDAGYQIEVDIWVLDDILYLGHDGPKYHASHEFIFNLENKAWFHCKNLEALYYFTQYLPQMNYFWHETDKFTLTSRNYIWTYPGEKTTTRSILVHLDKISDGMMFDGEPPYAICSDYVTNKERKVEKLVY